MKQEKLVLPETVTEMPVAFSWALVLVVVVVVKVKLVLLRSLLSVVAWWCLLVPFGGGRWGGDPSVGKPVALF